MQCQMVMLSEIAAKWCMGTWRSCLPAGGGRGGRGSRTANPQVYRRRDWPQSSAAGVAHEACACGTPVESGPFTASTGLPKLHHGAVWGRAERLATSAQVARSVPTPCSPQSRGPPPPWVIWAGEDRDGPMDKRRAPRPFLSCCTPPPPPLWWSATPRAPRPPLPLLPPQCHPTH